jgi:hypothetical protein
MKKGIPLIAVVFVTVILALTTVTALTASISNPRMVLYKEIVNGGGIEFTNSVVINNDNLGEVSINVVPSGVWEGRINVEESEFLMKPGERKEIFYNVLINERGYYQGDILITFSEEGSKNHLSAAQDLVVIVKDETGEVGDKITGSAIEEVNYLGTLEIVITIILTLVVILVLIWLYKKKK